MANAKSIPTPASRDLLALAQQLRAVRAAEKKFLSRWIEQRADALHPIVTNAIKTTNDQNAAPETDAWLLDALDHDWTNLYRGSVLDD